ncbi:immunoglobulin domain-containing protein [Acidovorax sp. LjRoot129]|uniref:immunoglobulin domain-containing protein n=1 Tax=Acidovorax sp. LjRoot129 TaxID=3342260 RepID=UPI003ECF5C72
MRKINRRCLGTGLLVAFLVSACGGGDDESTAGPALPVITLQPSDVSIVEGESARFTVAVNETAGVTFQWMRNNTAIYGGIQDTIVWTGMPVSSSGTVFTVRVTNAAGSVLSREARLTVTPRQAQ